MARKHIDIFCGPGALSLGWEKAGSDPALGVDIVEHAAHTYAANRPGTPTLWADVAKLDPAEVRRHIGKVDAITGGVPCEPFSKAWSDKDAQRADPRRNLIKTALKWVEAFQPRVFVFENVAPAAKSPQWLAAKRAMERSGYGVAFWKLVASDYGVPQARRRVFFVGVKGTDSEDLTPPEPTTPGDKAKTAKQAIGDLGEPSEGGRDPLHRPPPPLNEKARRAAAQVKPGQSLGKASNWIWNANRVIAPDEPAPTITASGRHMHWNKKRWLTNRELARLDSIPDSYKFPVPASMARSMLGDIVPVGLAAAVAKRALSFVTKAEDQDLDEAALGSALAELEGCLVAMPSQADVEAALWSGGYTLGELAQVHDVYAEKTFESEARTSEEEDVVAPGRAFLMPKPTRSAGPEERQTVERLVEIVKLPAVVQKKYDGARHQIHVRDGRVKIVSEDGGDNTARLPSVVEELRKLGHDLVLDAEIEAWEGRRHLPREVASGYLNSAGPADDSKIVANVFDVLYHDGDVHGKPIEERLALLDGLPIGQSTMGVPDTSRKLNKAPGLAVKDEAELERAARAVRLLPGSEGVVVKSFGSPYPLRLVTPESWVKYHNAAVIRGLVTGKTRTAGGVWVYDWGLLPGRERAADTVDQGGRQVVPVGETFGTSVDVEPGESVQIEAETLNYTRTPAGVDVGAWVPRVLGPAPRPDTVDDAVAEARKELVLSEKEVDAEGATTYKSLHWVEWQADPYMEIPPEEDAPYRYVVQHHWRGRSVHSDFRIELRKKALLIGWTLNTQIAGSVDEPVTSLAHAEAAVAGGRMAEVSKVDWRTGEWAKREKAGASQPVTVEILAEEKAPEPWVWLDVEGRTREPSAGEAPPIGGTRQYPGVFDIVDQGTVEYGTQKPWSHEYFMHGKGLNYRLVFRQLNLEKALGEFRDGSHLCAVLPLPPPIAKAFPEAGKDSEPHVTAVYFGDVPREKMGAVMKALVEACTTTAPFGVRLAKEVTYFEPAKNSDGKRVAKIAIESDGLRALHGRIKAIASKAGVDVDKDFPRYAPHATLAYLAPGAEYDGPVPSGEWEADGLSVWGLEERFDVPLGKPTVKAALPPSTGEGAPLPGPQWFAIKPDDLTPYVLSKDAIEKDWMPPIGVSALPEAVRAQVPKVMRYWEANTGVKARAQRDSIVFAIGAGQLKIDYAAPYKEKAEKALDAKWVLQEQTWRGPVVIRTGPSERLWFIRIESGGKVRTIRLTGNPLDNDQLAAAVEDEAHRGAMALDGEIAPGHWANPTKATPSRIDVVDGGDAVILSDTGGFLKLSLDGERLKGVFTAAQNEGGQEWLWSRTAAGPEVVKVYVPVLKVEEERRLVTGIVLEPDVVDAHGDVIRERIIEKAAHKFLSDYNEETRMGLMHRKFADNGIELAESWVAPCDVTINGVKIRQGTWVMTVHVVRDDVWGDVKAGRLTGFSIGGIATV